MYLKVLIYSILFLIDYWLLYNILSSGKFGWKVIVDYNNFIINVHLREIFDGLSLILFVSQLKGFYVSGQCLVTPFPFFWLFYCFLDLTLTFLFNCIMVSTHSLCGMNRYLNFFLMSYKDMFLIWNFSYCHHTVVVFRHRPFKLYVKIYWEPNFSFIIYGIFFAVTSKMNRFGHLMVLCYESC